MANSGGQTDVLRALGHWLDQQGASGVEITNYDQFLSVTWVDPTRTDGRRAYQEHELESLRAQAHMLRQDGHGIPGGSLAELLRTLGQEIDQDGIAVGGIVQEPKGFLVSGKLDGVYYSRLYLTDELREASSRRRIVRGPGAEQETVQGDRLLQGLVGIPVYSSDDQPLGKIGEVRDQHVRVQTGFLQRDYWIAASAVASIIPGKRVTLGFPKANLDQHRRSAASQDG
jgi:hypothetical protein